MLISSSEFDQQDVSAQDQNCLAPLTRYTIGCEPHRGRDMSQIRRAIRRRDVGYTSLEGPVHGREDKGGRQLGALRDDVCAVLDIMFAVSFSTGSTPPRLSAKATRTR